MSAKHRQGRGSVVKGKHKANAIVKRKDGQKGHVVSTLGNVCMFLPWDTGMEELHYHKDLTPSSHNGKRRYYDDIH